ncbi:MAG: CoA-acylating methylmalonate-semialdehyde dehydrogenase [Candidatus Latescibacteria bacterium]|nr:CoA-acylating methylmalonate-semialdehyde dehydrogenase [Candidatus Latescibacterota bacterium]
MATVPRLKNYVYGKWVEPDVSGWLDVHNPTTGGVIAECPLSTPGAVSEAADAAAEAYVEWSNTPVYRRCVPLLDLAAILRDREEEISRVLVLEQGKSLPDARAEVKRLVENTEVATGMPVMSQGDKVIGSSHGIDGEVLYLPVGVFGMIAPFNFPAMVPFWFMPYALACGNTYVVKASELVPMTMQLVFEWIDEAGFPPGVVNLVNGAKEAGQALVEHPKVAGISIVGQSETVQSVRVRCAELGKRCQAMGSAKNHLVAMPDANLRHVIRNMTTSCYGCAGQRCMASSAIVGVGDEMYGRLCDQFIEDSKKIIVTDPLDPAVADEEMVMGPVISRASLDRIHGLIETGVKEGATLDLDGRGIQVEGCEDGYFLGPTVFTDVEPGMEIHRTEIFGPVVVILKAKDLDEAIGIVNDHRYGNGGSIYTQDGYAAREFKVNCQCGMIGINVGIPAPVAYLPFGGMKDSQHAEIKAQGKAVVKFYTEEKIITERWWPAEED